MSAGVDAYPRQLRQRRPRKIRRRRSILSTLWLLPLPGVALYVFFFLVPMAQTFQYSITDWDGFSINFNYVGLENFIRMFTADDLFTNALGNTFKYLVVVAIFQPLLALCLALALARKTRTSVAIRALIFFPAVLSPVAVAYAWGFMYDANTGVITRIFGALGLHGLQGSFLGDQAIAIYLVAAVQVWMHTGQVAVIFIAGLMGVPEELYEAATLDGANSWQRFRHVTWPALGAATMIVVAYSTLQAFRSFDLILGLGGTPPKSSVDVIATRVYGSFLNNDFGYATAESLVLLALIVIVTLIQRSALRISQG